MNPSPISVVLINFNGILFIKECVESIFAQNLKPDEIIVVDNASNDGSLDFIKKNYNGIKIIENNYNAGFCKASNQGINFSKGEFIAILNVDVVLSKNFFEEIFKNMQFEEKIGIITGKILRMKVDCPSTPGWVLGTVPVDFIDSTGQFIGKDLRPKERGYKEIDTGKYEKAEFVFSACAACCIYKRDMLNDIKFNAEYFDEDFFSYFEDFDLGWRAYYKGWKAYYIPTAICFHARGGSSSVYQSRIITQYEFPKKPVSIQKHIIINRYIVLIKNAPIKLILRQIPWIIKYEILLIFYLLFFNFPLIFTPKGFTFFNIVKQLNKRKLLKQNWTLSQSKSKIYKWIL